MADIIKPAGQDPADSDTGPSLVPMLIWGLILITLSMIGVMFFF